MTDYGVVPEGFRRKTQAEILADIEARQRATVSPLLDVSAESPNGQNNAIFAREIALGWEALEDIYHALDPDAAEGAALAMTARLTGTERVGATFSRGSCDVNLDVGTTLESGVHFATVDGDPSQRATPEEDFTAPSTGSHTIFFRAEFAGAMTIPDGELTVIGTPVTGWNAVENTEDIDGGKEIDTDAELRERRAAQLTASGSSTIDAIGADILEIADEDGNELVQSVRMFNNPTGVANGDGLPAHSFEALIYDGDPAAVDDDVLAQTIWDAMPAGIRAHGSSSGNAEDANGDTHVVAFSRVAPVEIYVDYTLTTGDGYVGDAALKTYVATQANALFNRSGDDVDILRIANLPYALAGVTKVVSYRIGLTASPVGTTDLAIGPRSLARFDSGRVTLTP